MRYENGTMDACSGDSGGPLVQFRDDQRAEVTRTLCLCQCSGSISF